MARNSGWCAEAFRLDKQLRMLTSALKICCASVILDAVTKKRAANKVSPSAKRPLCKVHHRPIRASRWLSGHRTTGCPDCYRSKKMPPPKKRQCQEHKHPILRQRWWSGYRTKGCVLCYEVPPPEDRLCRKHDRPIQPSAWIRGRHSTGCSKCFNSRPGYAAAQARCRARARLRLVRAKRRNRRQSSFLSKSRRGR